MCMDDLERLEAFVELGQYLNSMRDYYDSQKIIEIFFDCLSGKEFLKLKLDLVKKQLDYIESHNDILDREYALERFATTYLDLLKKSRASKKEISAIHEKYWRYPPIRMDCIHACIDNKEYPCTTSLTMKYIGGKWKTVILIHLINKKRYSELRKMLPMVTERTLSLQFGICISWGNRYSAEDIEKRLQSILYTH